MSVNAQRLEGLTSAEFAKAERLFRHASWVQLSIAGAAAASIFVTSTTGTVLAALISLLLYLVWALLDWQYRDSRSQAERGRRALLIVDGLGGPVSPSELREVESCFSSSKAEGEAAQNAEFFASERATGKARLSDLLQESSFYSCRLYRMSAHWAWKRLTFSLAAFVGLFTSSILIANSEQLAVGARLLCTILTFLVSNEVLGTARAYMRAHEALSPIQARITSLRRAGYPEGELHILLGDYNAAVESAPMMAPGVYERARDELDELWRRHTEDQTESA